MKILADENIPHRTVRELRAMGHDVLDIRGTPNEGMRDTQLWKLAQGEERLLITTDKGFATHRNESHHGILIIRLRQPNRHRIHRRVIQAITQAEGRQWPGLLVVMRDYAQSTWRVRQDE
jgi:predicted nuclease of predicted toxin-antitoxin system